MSPPTKAKIYAKDLSAGERSALMSLFRLSHGRVVQFELTENAAECFAAIADGTANDSVHWIISLPEAVQKRVIWMGQAPFGWPSSGVFVITRPVSWPRLLVRLENSWLEMHNPSQPHQQPPLAIDLPAPRQLPAQSAQNATQTARISILGADRLAPNSSSHRAFARTEPDSNQRFAVDDPLAAQRSAPDRRDFEQVAHETSTSIESPFKSLNVMVVDDQALARHALAKSLNFFSVTPLEADSAPAAVRLTVHGFFDLIFLDVNMPGQDGYSLCRDFKRSRGPQGDALVVMVTSRDGLIDKLRGSLAGADYFLTKPASPLDVEPILKQALARHLKAVKEGRLATLK